jgi:hypothetical protein
MLAEKDPERRNAAMIFPLDLTDEELRRVEAAQEKGIDVAALLRGVIAGLPPAPDTRVVTEAEDPTITLLELWLREDATDDPEEIGRAEEELAVFKRHMNAPRKEAGERLLYPEAE